MGDALGLPGGDGSGLAGLSGRGVALGGDTHLDEVAGGDVAGGEVGGGELSKLLADLFLARDRPLRLLKVIVPSV